MSTRSIIGYYSREEECYLGLYHHWDGYPEGLGHTLYQWMQVELLPSRYQMKHSEEGSLYSDMYEAIQQKVIPNTAFGRREFGIKWLFETSPAGWSTINGGDLTLKPSWDVERDRRMQSYTARGESPNVWMQKSPMAYVGKQTWIEFAYIFQFDEEKQTVFMDIYDDKKKLAEFSFADGNDFVTFLYR
jgi:hypothetical protein